jgi:DNA-directed RNA polymerase III subunit RPC2
MPHGGMWRWIGQMLATTGTAARHAATERYRAFVVYPASIRYGREPGLVLLILLIGTSYAVVAPLLAPMCLGYMATAYLLWRQQIIYVCQRCYESGGRHWPTFATIITWCLALFVCFTSFLLLLKRANLPAVALLGLGLPALYRFHERCERKYKRAARHLPLWLAYDAPRALLDPAVYVAPALRPGAAGWWFESGKAWVRWGVPMYYQ